MCFLCAHLYCVGFEIVVIADKLSLLVLRVNKYLGIVSESVGDVIHLRILELRRLKIDFVELFCPVTLLWELCLRKRWCFLQ
jgi:hypothetical protein